MYARRHSVSPGRTMVGMASAKPIHPCNSVSIGRSGKLVAAFFRASSIIPRLMSVSMLLSLHLLRQATEQVANPGRSSPSGENLVSSQFLTKSLVLQKSGNLVHSSVRAIS
jgi:hypothetical protein